MFQLKTIYLGILLLALVHLSNTTIIRRKPNSNDVSVARAAVRAKSRSTSSDSSDPDSGKKSKGSKDGGKTSLDISSSSISTSDESRKKEKKGKVPHDKEMRGWRRWHRKCTPCPQDDELKWRDPRITWICGGYQRARRSFKSECSMYLRNCQDGTMFTKISDGKCEDDEEVGENGTTLLPPHGRHFFYDYRVHLSDDRSSMYKDSDSKTTDSSSTDSN